MYAASKQAIKGFTDAFRMELEAVGAPISLTLIKPSAIDTPFPAHAKNYLDAEPTLPPPVYTPADVAEAIVYAAVQGGRDYYIGGGGKLISSLNKHIPSAVDWMASRMGGLETGGPRKRDRAGSLHAAGADGSERGKPTFLVRRSAYTAAQTRPWASLPLLAAGAVVVALLARSSRA